MLELKQVYIPKKPKREYFIKKILIKNIWEQVDIIYQSWGKGAEEETKFTCKEKPNQRFPDAIAQLVPHVHAICGLNAQVWAAAFVSEIRFKEVEGGTVAMITAKSEIGNYTVTVSTPWIFPQNELLDKLSSAIAETEDYIAGLRLPTII